MKIPWRAKVPYAAKTVRFYSRVGNRPIGLISGLTDGGVTYLTDLWVEPEYRDQGRATALMNRFLKEAEGTTVILLTSEAQEFYRKFGFEERVAMVRRGK